MKEELKPLNTSGCALDNKPIKKNDLQAPNFETYPWSPAPTNC